MTLNGHFALNSVLCGHAGVLKRGFRTLATLKLVLNVVGEKNSCGIARFPCDSTIFLFVFVDVLVQKNSLIKLAARTINNGTKSANSAFMNEN